METEYGLHIPRTLDEACDLGHLPIVVTDACGPADAAAARRSLDTLAFTGGTLLCTAAEPIAALAARTGGGA